MKLSNSYFYTLRENPNDEESVSGILLNRAGFIKKSSAGVYMFMPMGLRVLQNIETIVKEEMYKAGCQELVMPCLIPEEVYEASGRRKNFGPSMFSLKDRSGKPMVLGPTHEELFAIAAGMKIKSYKDLPFSLYQMHTKFRDEARPRFGLIRVKEFVMKDAYSFDKDYEGLDIAYDKQFNAYKNIFERLGIDYKIVRADTGVMGGLLSEEFQAISDIGEDTVVLCDKCDFASNIEVSECVEAKDDPTTELPLEMVATPNKESIEEVCEFLHLPTTQSVKALLMNVDGKLVIFFIRGDRELNETKVLKLLHGSELNFADDALIATSNAVAGFTGPVGLNAKIVVDREVLHMKNFVTGANKVGYHYINTNITDFKYDVVGDIVNVKEGDICPKCSGRIHFKKGIEVGNTFKLGTKYSEAMNLNYQDSDGSLKPVVMGCYGFGVGRAMAALVEQNHDDNGIIWPINVAPYKCAIVLINKDDEVQNTLANKLYDTLMANGIEPLMDDRNERPGVKFKDIELIGIPMRITVGKNAIEDKVEFRLRTATENTLLTTQEAIDEVLKLDL